MLEIYFLVVFGINLDVTLCCLMTDEVCPCPSSLSCITVHVFIFRGKRVKRDTYQFKTDQLTTLININTLGCILMNI